MTQKPKKQIALILTPEEYQRLREHCAARNMRPRFQIVRLPGSWS
jgi:hypothetical protein